MLTGLRANTRQRAVASTALILLMLAASAVVSFTSTAGTVHAMDYGLENHTVYAAADAYINESSPTTNYGTATDLWAFVAPENRTFLKFSLTGIPPKDHFSQEWVKYYVSDVGTAADIWYTDISYDGGVGFNEMTLNWNSRNTQATAVGIIGTSDASNLGWRTVLLDNTTFVSWYDNGNLWLSLQFVGGANAFSIKSKEAGSAYWPQLIIEYYAVDPMYSLENKPVTYYNLPGYAGRVGDNYALALSGWAENMKQEEVLMVKWIVTHPGETVSQNTAGVWNSGWQVHAFGKNNNGVFSLTSPNLFVENTYYVLSAWESGQYLGYISAEGWWYFVPHDNTIVLQENVGPPTARVYTRDASSVTEDSALLNFDLVLNDDKQVQIWFQTANDDSLSWDNHLVGWYSNDVSLGYWPWNDLENDHTYYFRVKGYRSYPGGGDLLPYGEIKAFKTGAGPKIPSVPTEPKWDISAIPAGLAASLNISKEAAGIMLSLMCMMALLVPLLFLGIPGIGMVGMIVILIGLFTALTWIPIWIAIVVGLGFSLLLAREIGSF